MILKAYKTKLKLNNVQRGYMNECAGAARFVFNWALADRIDTYEKTSKSGSMYEQKKRFNSIKDDICPWIRQYPYALLAEEFAHVDSAYKNFFSRVKKGETPGFPKFKSRYGRKSFCLRGCIHTDANMVKLPRIGWIRIAEGDYIPDDIRILFVTISERANNWFISFQVEEGDPQVVSLNDVTIGIDRGIKSTAVISNGRYFINPKALSSNMDKLGKLQRKLARQQRGSNNYKKTKVKISKLHEKISNIRRHHLHDISSYVTNQVRPDRIVIEDLNISGMSRKARAKQDENGKYLPNNQAQKRGLNRNIMDASMGELGRQIRYKSEWFGIDVMDADRWFASSKTCSSCGHVDEGLKLNDRTYACSNCGLIIDRDMNAAVNLAQLT